MNYSISFIIASVLVAFSMNARCQTPAEKVAIAFCECSDKDEYQGYADMLNSGDTVLMRSMVDTMQALFYRTKRCARNRVVLSKEEGRRVPEDEIGAALVARCPNVEFVHTEYRRISWEIQEEDEARDIAERFATVDRHIEASNPDSARYELDEFISWYGSSEHPQDLIKFYYRLGDIETAKNVAKELIDELQEDFHFSDSYEIKKQQYIAFVKNELLELVTKHEQSEMIDLINALK